MTNYTVPTTDSGVSIFVVPIPWKRGLWCDIQLKLKVEVNIIRSFEAVTGIHIKSKTWHVRVRVWRMEPFRRNPVWIIRTNTIYAYSVSKHFGHAVLCCDLFCDCDIVSLLFAVICEKAEEVVRPKIVFIINEPSSCWCFMVFRTLLETLQQSSGSDSESESLLHYGLGAAELPQDSWKMTFSSVLPE
jgi:hypothetical protein